MSLLDKINELEYELKQVQARFQELGFDYKPLSQSKYRKRFGVVTQTSVYQTPIRAYCVDTIDPWKMNRVRFFCPLIHNPKTPIQSLPFASPIANAGGFDDCGMNWVPPAGSTIVIIFENGNRYAPMYLGTVWDKDRGPGGNRFSYPIEEFFDIHAGHRKGYLVGPDDESQVLPPWNTENYNSGDFDAANSEFKEEVDISQKATNPHIYGFKTPQKHAVKMHDGDPKCGRRWKRFEIFSSNGNWMCFKDDHLHFSGQWAHPSCPPDPNKSCSVEEGSQPCFSSLSGEPIEDPSCGGNILGGHPRTPQIPEDQRSVGFTDLEEQTLYHDSQGGCNAFFKHKNECRPFKGPGTPQNNRADLPQTGIQILSISGHSFVMDDSVEEPSGELDWERSLEDFDFGCNDKYQGRMYIKSATGHTFAMSDIEDDSRVRGQRNYIRLLTANGNRIELNDHTKGASSGDGCPPNLAGEKRGIHLETTSKHSLRMIDHNNEQCSPTRKEGGVPVNRATDAFIQMESGYGLEFRMNDDHSQQETQDQFIQLLNPQSASGGGDPTQNIGEGGRGPHILRMQAAPKGNPGIVYLRSGGVHFRETYDTDFIIVGNQEKNPANKITFVTKDNLHVTQGNNINISEKSHVFFAEDKIMLLAGRNCPPGDSETNAANSTIDQENFGIVQDDEKLQECQPCVYPVVIGRCAKICPFTKWVHFTEQSLSETVFASGEKGPPVFGESCDTSSCTESPRITRDSIGTPSNYI